MSRILPSLISVLAWAWIGLAAPVAAADAGDEFAALARAAGPAALVVSMNDGAGAKLRVGDDVSYRFETAAGGYVTAFYVDAHGVTTVVIPSVDALSPGASVAFPPDGLALSVGPPVGPADLYAIATPAPLDRALLGLATGEDVTTLDRERALSMAKQLRASLEGTAAQVARLEHRVIGRDDTEYTVSDVVAYMGPTRAIERPKLDLHVNFAFDSADLTDEGRKNLDVVGQALSHAELSEDRFVLGGHTDDLGEDHYNDALSMRRAQVARDYLAETWNVDPSRIEVRGYGEAQPLEALPTDEARQLNRRVELELIQ